MSAWICGLVGVLIGLFIGGAVGMFALAICIVAHEEDKKSEREMRELMGRWGERGR